MKQPLAHPYNPLALIILDGWGYRQERQHNPCLTTSTPFIDQLFKQYPHRLLSASGLDVGLPEGQMGNSEVGHLHLGAGRLVRQDLTRIDHAIQTGEFAKNPTLLSAIQTAQAKKSRIHVLGLASSGGVHSHVNHLEALIRLIQSHGVTSYLHAFLDGRDAPPQSAEPILKTLEALYRHIPQSGGIVSLCGRYYAMDRDQRWGRTQQAYDLIVSGRAAYWSETAFDALQCAYARGETDEFISPTCIHPEGQSPLLLQKGDVIIFINFRADRARQLCHALLDENFHGFSRSSFIALSDFVTFTEYDPTLSASVVFPPLSIQQGLAEVLSQHHIKQLRIAETEKYAHVTYFFNGGVEIPYPLETRLMIPSPHVATYDLQPEMSAITLTDKLCEAITQGDYGVIICNYANPDMVGHTGNETAAATAMQTMDGCLARVIGCLLQKGGAALITADHGNIECMYNEQTQQPHTAHTLNPVPLIFTDKRAYFDEAPATLSDVAPTMLSLLNIPTPPQMTGRKLVYLD